jgi:hypothetical protein
MIGAGMDTLEMHLTLGNVQRVRVLDYQSTPFKVQIEALHANRR